MENLKLDDFTKYNFISGVKISPDKKHACFVVKVADVEENKYKSNLWLYRMEEDRYFQLTSFDEESMFIWMDDSEHIIFSGTRNPKDKEKLKDGEEFTQYYKINIYGGEAVPTFSIPKSVTSIKVLDNDNYIFTAVFDFNKPDISKMSDEEKEKEKKRLKEERDYEVLDEIPYWANGRGFNNKKRNRLYLFNSKDKEVTDLSEELNKVIGGDHFTILSGELNQDRTKFVFVAEHYKNKMELTNEVYLLDISQKKAELISPKGEYGYGIPNFLSDSIIIVDGTDMRHYGINENNKFYTIDIHSKEQRCLTPDLDISMVNMVGSDCRLGNSSYRNKIDNGYLYFYSTEVDSSYLNRINANGEIERLIDKRGSVDDYDVKDGEIIFIAMRDLNLQEVYRHSGSKETKITDFNGFIKKEKKLSNFERVMVETAKDIRIDGWILKPVDFDPNKKYPAILDIHGGPKTVYGEVFYHEAQYWVNEGYTVFFCNPRGSDGKGNDFADIRGKYGTIDYNDIMKFTDFILNEYTFIDKDKVGVTGGSYGGFMTNWIIGHTNRFSAAASQRSISNWISKFNTTDIGYYFNEDQIQATPWQNFEQIWESSPIKYADKVKTPTLFIHSEQDYRCWVDQGYQMFTALKYHGVEARMCMFRDENHELSRGGKPKHRIRRLKEITSWFDKYLKGKSDS